jgi:hypothetical protein
MSFEEHTAEDFQNLMSVNFGGTFYGCKHAVIQFKRQGDGGVICNTGSVAGLVGWGGALYGSAKGAIHQLTRAVAVECAPHNIRANAVCPAAMPLTGFLPAGGMSPAVLEQRMAGLAAMHPLGRYITAEDCAEAALFLCCDLARNVTGVLLPVDGGYVARLPENTDDERTYLARPRPRAGDLQPARPAAPPHGRGVRGRPVPDLAPAARGGAGAPRHRPRADRRGRGDLPRPARGRPGALLAVRLAGL